MSYIINAPVTIQNTTAGDVIDFDSDATLAKNVVQNFVTNAAGDIIYRAAGGTNSLARLAIGTSGQVLTVSGGIPSWGSNSAVATGFSAAKTAGDTFTTPASIIGNWNLTSPGGGIGMNPFYNTGGFTVGTGKFVAPSTGAYAIDAHIEYTNTNNGGFRSLTFDEEIAGPTYINILTEGGANGVQTTGNIAATQILDLHGVVMLLTGKTYVIRARATAGVATMLTTSRYSITLLGL